jgi:hypothetical protein
MSKCFEERGSWRRVKKVIRLLPDYDGLRGTLPGGLFTAVIPKRIDAEGPRGRSSASALHHRHTSRCANSYTVAQSAYVRSLAVCAARDDTLLLARQQLAQDERQNAAVAVVINFNRGIDPQLHGNGFALSIFARDLKRDHLPGFDRV